MRPAARALAVSLACLSGCAMSSAGRAPSRQATSTAASPPPPPQAVTTTATSLGGGYAPAPSTTPMGPDAPAPRSSAPVEDGDSLPRTPGTTVQSISEERPVSGQGGEADRARLQEARIGAQVQRIRDEQIRIATNPGVCRDVCFAAGSICLAAQEVCHLAGDEDARCGRARTACAEAGQQRDATCPVCPPTH